MKNDELTPLPDALAQPLERFYAYLHTEKGLSLYTQRNYKQQLETMTQYLVQVGSPTGHSLIRRGCVNW